MTNALQDSAPHATETATESCGPMPSECRGREHCPLCRQRESRDLFRVHDHEHGVSGEWLILQCASCGCCFHAQMPTPAEIASFYPSAYTAYAAGGSTEWMFRVVYWMEARRIRRLIGSRGRILDVGCGNGAALLAMRSRCDWDLWGVEFSAEAATRARNAGLSNVQIGDLSNADLPEGTFDLIRMGHVVEHVVDPKAMFRRALSLLKPGGLLFGETINTSCWDFHLFGRYWGGWHGPRHVVLFNCRNLRDALVTSGFAQVRISPRLRPVGWGAGLQNYLAAKGVLRVPPSGRVSWYGAIVLPVVAVTALQAVSSWTATVGFVARKPHSQPEVKRSCEN